MPTTLKFASICLSPSPPYPITREKFPEGAAARCCALLSVNVSGWGEVITSRLQFGEGVLISISNRLYYSKHKDFCHDIQT